MEWVYLQRWKGGCTYAEQYMSILEDNLLPSMENSETPEESIIFQQDNDSKYSSKRAQNWFKFEGIRLLD